MNRFRGADSRSWRLRRGNEEKEGPPSTAVALWQNRIVGVGEEAPDQLLANPLNFRVHPGEQQDALEAILGRVGIVAPVIVNRRTGRLIDGHLRVSLALRRRQPLLQVVYVDLTEEEERQVLVTFDAVGDMAAIDRETLREALDGLELQDEGLQALLESLRAQATPAVPPEEFPAVDDRLSTNHECPKCGFRWQR